MSKFNFLEHGHVAFKIKGNHGCSNMVENILTMKPPPTPSNPGGQKAKIKFLQNIYQIKQILEFRNMAANILPTYLLPTPLDLGCGVKGQNSTS